MRMQRLTDGALVAACLALTVLAVKTPWSPFPRPVIALVGILGSLTLWFRRQRPEVAAVAGAITCVVGGNPGPLIVGLYSSALYLRRRYIWAIAIVGWAGFAGWASLADEHLTTTNAVYAAIGTAAIVGVGLYVATRLQLTESWRARAVQSDAERRLRDEQARAAERTRIAHEMHDVLAHKVSLIALHAGALEVAADSPKTHQAAALIRVTAREALQELRQVLGLLRETPSDPFADIGALVAASTQAGQRVEFHDGVGPLPPATARVVYRVAQEGLTNARKYAPDAAASLAVERADDGTITVTVRNDGSTRRPMDLPGSGAGLVGLAERVRLAGGTLQSGPLDDGWELRAVLPRPVSAEESL